MDPTDLPPTPTPDSATDAADGGWTVESHSAPSDLPPLDTTAATLNVERATAPAEVTTDDPSQTKEVTETAGAVATPPAAKPAKHKPSLDERRKSLTTEIDTLTFTKHQTAREIAEAQTELTRLRAERAALGAAPAETSTKPAEPPARPGPAARPRYRDFETDEDYETALGAWQTRRDEAMKADITQGLDARLERQRAEEVFVSRLSQAKQAHPDWDEKAETLKTVRSPWANPQGQAAPFLADVIQNDPDAGAEFLYRLGADPELAQAAATLQPTRPVRDAIVLSSSPTHLLAYFATPDGQRVFEQLKGMHPVRLHQAVGALSARVTAATSGPVVPVLHPMTGAVPSAKPPVGSPRARESTGSGTMSQSFEDWMAAEDAKDRASRVRDAGMAVTR